MNTQSKRLYRSRTQRMIGGVCAGIGDYLNMDPTVIRILFVLLGFVTGGTWLIVYIILLFVMPEEPTVTPPATTAPPAPTTGPTPTDEGNLPPEV